MADAPIVSTRKISRDQLATFLKSHELIKAFENLIQDVSVALPEAALEDRNDIELALLDALFPGSAAQISEVAKRLDDLQSQMDEAPAQIAELRKELEGLRMESAMVSPFTVPWDRPGTIGALTPNTGKFTIATFPDQAVPATPAAGTVNLFAKAAPSGVTRLEMQTSTGAELAFFRDSVLTVRNASGSSISKGQMVYITGSNGVVPTVGLAKADSITTTRMVGMALSNIANNAFGTIQTGGEIRGINTSAFVDGDVLWLSASTAGGMTATEPTSPNLAMRIGTVVLSNASGTIQLFIQPAVINWGAPNAIGNGTPAAGTFTTVTGSKFLTSTTTVAGVASGVATTIVTLPNSTPATYLVSANIGVTLDAVNYGAFAIVYADGTSARMFSNSNGALHTLTLAGLAIQSTQGSGAPQPITVTITKIG